MSHSSLTVPPPSKHAYTHKHAVLQAWVGPSRLEHGLAARSLVQTTPVWITMAIIIILIIIRALILIVIFVVGLASRICSSNHSTVNT